MNKVDYIERFMAQKQVVIKKISHKRKESLDHKTINKFQFRHTFQKHITENWSNIYYSGIVIVDLKID